jgi:hydrogenase maturation protease
VTGAPDGHAMPRRVVVLACGQALRGDDAVAARAVEALPSDARRRADVRPVGALGPDDLVALEPDAPVVVVDAVAGVEPGRVVSLALDELGLRSVASLVCSTHQLPIDRVIGLANLLRDVPVRGRFVGLGIDAVLPGAPLSAPVAAALPRFRAAIAEAVEALASESPEARGAAAPDAQPASR